MQMIGQGIVETIRNGAAVRGCAIAHVPTRLLCRAFTPIILACVLGFHPGLAYAAAAAEQDLVDHAVDAYDTVQEASELVPTDLDSPSVSGEPLESRPDAGDPSESSAELAGNGDACEEREAQAPEDAESDDALRFDQEGDSSAQGAVTLSPQDAVEASPSGDEASIDADEGLPDVVVLSYESGKAKSKVIDVARSSVKEGAKVGLYQANSRANQRFRLERSTQAGLYRLVNVNSNMALAPKDGRTAIGVEITQRPVDSGDACQLWRFVELDGGTHAIQAALCDSSDRRLLMGYDESSLRLCLQGAGSEAVPAWLLNDTRTVDDGVYRISSRVGSGHSLDIGRASLSAGANAHIWSSNESNAQRFSVAYDANTGYYTIANVASGMALDVSRASTSRGANVLQWTPSGKANQQWSLEPLGGGAYRVVSRVSGLVLDVSRASTKNGTNVCQWAYTGARNQQWDLEATDPVEEGCYYISPFASNGFNLDVQGGRVDSFANVHLWKAGSAKPQCFEILRYSNDGWYTLRNAASGLYVSVMRASSTSGSNVDVEGGPVMDDGRLWQIKPQPGGLMFVSATGLSLDVQRASFKSGTNVIAYAPNGKKSQRFVLTIRNRQRVGITEVAIEGGQDGSSQPLRIESLMEGDTPTIYLPASLRDGRVRLTCLSTRQGHAAQVSFSEKGTYADADGGASLDLSRLERNRDGSLALWLKTHGQSDPRKVRIVYGSSRLGIDAARAAVFSHRGASSQREEHSLSAYDLAIAQGSRQIELDVIASRTGTLYVSHDMTAKRLTGVDASFRDMSDAQIDGLRTKEGNPVLKMRDVLNRYGSDVTYVIELKERQGTVEAFAEFLDGVSDVPFDIIAQSWSLETLELLERCYPQVRRLFLSSGQSAFASACASSSAQIVAVDKGLMSKENCKLAHGKGKLLCAWTLDARDDIARAISLGVDCYFTDCTAKAIALEFGLRSA